MTIVVFGNKKGGVGKSMTALNLSGAIISRAIRQDLDTSKSVVIVDADTNETIVNYIRRREAFNEKYKSLHGQELPFIKVELRRPDDSLTRDLVALDNIYDYVIVDTGGYENKAFKSAVGVADAVYLPFQPAQVDIEQLIPTLFVIKGVEDNYRDIRGDDNFTIDARLLLTLVEHGSRDLFSEAKEVCKQLLDFASISGVSIPKVKAVCKIQDSGLTLFDPQPNKDKTKFSSPHVKRAAFDLLLAEIDGERPVEVKRNTIVVSDAPDT